jgi:Predicted acyltransferases
MQQQHYRVFDAWRFAAALVVMLYHFLHYDPNAASWLPDTAARLQQVIDLFFILSGFVIMSAYANTEWTAAGFRRFIVRRLSRIYPMHLLTLGFFTALGVGGVLGVVPIANPARYDFSTLPAQVLLVHAWGVMPELTFNYVSWSISAEWMAYLLFPLMTIAFRRGGLPALFVLFIGAALGVELLVGVGVIPQERWIDTATFGAFRALPSFILGCCCAVVIERWRIPVRTLLPGALVFVLTIVGMATLETPYVILGGFALATVLTAGAERNNPDCSRIFARFRLLGQASFGIYMLHPVFGSFLMALIWERLLGPAGVVNFYLWLAFGVVLVIAGAIASLVLIEAPLRRAINARFAPWQGKLGAVPA